MPGLSLRALTLSHFRSHRTARLELDGRPVATLRIPDDKRTLYLIVKAPTFATVNWLLIGY